MNRRDVQRSRGRESSSSEARSVAPGKRALTDSLQRKAAGGPAAPVATRAPMQSGSALASPAPVATAPTLSGGDLWSSDQSFLDGIHFGPIQRKASGEETPQVSAQAIAAQGFTGAAQPLPFQQQIQASFGRHSVAGIEAHVGSGATAASLQLGAQAYAMGNSVAFGGTPDLHTAAHEAAHVIQQRAGLHLKDGMGEVGDVHERHADAVADLVVQGKPAESLLDQYGGSGGGGSPVQCSFSGAVPIPGSTSGFEIDLATRGPFPAKAGLEGTIRFVPAKGSPNSNVIALHQIVKLTDDTGADQDPVSMPADRAARGALGTHNGVRTEDNAATGVEGGFFTDTLHGPLGAGPNASPNQPLSSRYPFSPTGNQTPGFKRSDNQEDMKSATMFDFPGVASNTAKFDFAFETVARGEDTNIDYGTVKWGFGLRGGAVVNEREPQVVAGSSATFHEALERHRDFYVQEPVTFYFDFDRDVLNATELAKIDAFLDYLTRNPDVKMSLQGFADQRGNAAYNVDLSRRRAEAVRAALIARAIDAAKIDTPSVATGASTAATDATSEVPAGTGDLGGNAAVGADQDREANRWANRRVVLTFRHDPGAAPAGPAPAGPAPAGPAPAGP
jgi:outer membrane protein OmpA-like peptidoglycan-associated protein